MSVLENKLVQIKKLLSFQVNHHTALQEVLNQNGSLNHILLYSNHCQFTDLAHCQRSPEKQLRSLYQIIQNMNYYFSENNFKTGSIDQGAQLPSIYWSRINLHWLFNCIVQLSNMSNSNILMDFFKCPFMTTMK